MDFKGFVFPFGRQKDVVAVRQHQGVLHPFGGIEIRPEQIVHIGLGQAGFENRRIGDAGNQNAAVETQ